MYHEVVWVELEVQVDVVDDLLGSVLGEAAELQAGFVLVAPEPRIRLTAYIWQLQHGTARHAALHVAHADRAVAARTLGERDGDTRAP